MTSSLPAGASDHVARLGSLGIEAEQLTEALGASNTERRLCDADHCAKSAPGYYAYNGMLSSMSRQMCADAWERHDPMSMPLLVNHGREIVVAVTSGDAYTGLIIAGQKPTTRNPKGELTRALIAHNADAAQLPLLEIAEKSSKKEILEKISKYTFWLVLVHYDKHKNEIRCEVSQPLDSTAKGFPSRWGLRIMMPPYSVEPIDFGDDDPNEGFDSFEVDVPRR